MRKHLRSFGSGSSVSKTSLQRVRQQRFALSPNEKFVLVLFCLLLDISYFTCNLLEIILVILVGNLQFCQEL